MVNQILLSGLIQCLSEGVRFAQKSGLDIQRVVETLRHGAAQSWQLENRALTMAEGQFEFGFAVDLMLKDLGIAESQAQAIGAHLPVTRMVREYYRELSALGGGRLDTSSLIKRL
jgi:3-hydroxyisobutyrate dehydrogenase-like beta-hydroxyacid dehydrogenase